MGVRTLEGIYDGTTTKAVMIDSVTGTAFGPLFESAEEVDGFLEFLAGGTVDDPRLLSQDALEDLLKDFRDIPTEAWGEEDES